MAQNAAQPAAAAPAPEPAAGGFVALIAAADPAKGQAASRRCLACHTVEKTGANKIGPKLWGVVNRPVASVPDYSYSDAMKEFSAGGQKAWTYSELDPYLLDPKAHVPGTKMVFPGIKKDDERASVIAYLRTLADAPAPLP